VPFRSANFSPSDGIALVSTIQFTALLVAAKQRLAVERPAATPASSATSEGADVERSEGGEPGARDASGSGENRAGFPNIFVPQAKPLSQVGEAGSLAPTPHRTAVPHSGGPPATSSVAARC
jgi:hypothetical protein